MGSLSPKRRPARASRTIVIGLALVYGALLLLAMSDMPVEANAARVAAPGSVTAVPWPASSPLATVKAWAARAGAENATAGCSVDISKRVSLPTGQPVLVGHPVTFTVAITNTGTVALAPVQLVDNYEDYYLAFESSAPALPDLQATGVLTWSDVTAGTSLAPNQSASYTVTFNALHETPPGSATVNLVAVSATCQTGGSASDYAWAAIVIASGAVPPPTPAPSPTPWACSDVYEPDNDLAHAHNFNMLDGHREQHTFHEQNDVDFFVIDGVYGVTYTLTTSDLLSVTDTIMHLYDRNGNLIDINDDIHYPDNIASRMTWTAYYDGPYYLRVRDFYWRGDCLGYTISGSIGPRILRSYLPVLRVAPSPTPTATPPPAPTNTPTGVPTPVTPTSTPDPAGLPTAIPVPGMVYANGVAVNSITHRVYVTGRDSNNVSMVDGMTLQLMGQTGVGSQPWGVVVNPATNKLYVSNFGSSDIYVLDANNLAFIRRIQIGTGPSAQLSLMALNPSTNRIIVAGHGYNLVYVINGNNDQLEYTESAQGVGTWGIAVNPTLNRVYVGNRDSNTIVSLDGNKGYTRIDGQTLGSACHPGGSPYALAFNPDNDKLYVSCATGGNVNTAAVFRAANAGLTEIAWQAIGNGGKDGGGGVAIDGGTSNAFFSNAAANSVSVLRGNSNSLAATVPAGANPFGVAVDASTHRVFIGDRGANTLYVMVDTFNP